MLNKIKDVILTKPEIVPLTLVAAVAIMLSGLYLARNTTNLQNNTAMITNKDVTHGGTGIVYKSTAKGSYVLTNDHVCRAIKDGGGVIKTTQGTYQVQSMLESQVSDLCLTFTPANLNQNTKVASTEPKFLDTAKVSGHPALMPTVITTGHFSGRDIIQVVTGFTPCTNDELSNPQFGLICLIFGGVPVIKSYESLLVTATIMPGSSGSGVYNENDELSGVVFAGSGDIGYAWTVPYDQMVAFLTNEVSTGKWTNLDQQVHILEKTENSSKHLKEVLKKCNEATDERVLNLCSVLRRDTTWVK